MARGDRLAGVDHLQSSRRVISERGSEGRRSVPPAEVSDALLSRHVAALVHKRVSNFRRDKKAWCCTTLLPSFFVLLGFLAYMRSAGSRNLPDLALSVADLNTGITEVPINPVTVNDGGLYTCRPGPCLVDNVFSYGFTGETYTYCLGINENSGSCTVQSASNTFDNIVGNDRASTISANVSSLGQVSCRFLLT